MARSSQAGTGGTGGTGVPLRPSHEWAGKRDKQDTPSLEGVRNVPLCPTVAFVTEAIGGDSL